MTLLKDFLESLNVTYYLPMDETSGTVLTPAIYANGVGDGSFTIENGISPTEIVINRTATVKGQAIEPPSISETLRGMAISDYDINLVDMVNNVESLPYRQSFNFASAGEYASKIFQFEAGKTYMMCNISYGYDTELSIHFPESRGNFDLVQVDDYDDMSALSHYVLQCKFTGLYVVTYFGYDGTETGSFDFFVEEVPDGTTHVGSWFDKLPVPLGPNLATELTLDTVLTGQSIVSANDYKLYKFIAPSAVATYGVIVTSPVDNLDTEMFVWRVPENDEFVREVWANDDYGGTTQSGLNFDSQAINDTFYICIIGYDYVETGNFEIEVRSTPLA